MGFIPTGTYVGNANVYSYIIFRNSAGSGIGSIASNTALTGTLYTTTSDYRLKNNVAPISGALDKISKINPVTYKWIVNDCDGIGFIAHELQEIAPECVLGEKDAVDKDGNPIYQSVDATHLVATLVAAIKELSDKFDNLNSDFDDYKKINSSINNKSK